MAPSSPTVASWELGLRLRERRESLGLTGAQVAKRVGCTQGYLSDVERGKTKVAAEKLSVLVEVYEIDRDEAAELNGLREQGNQRAWWNAYSALFNDDLQRFFGYEHGAKSIWTYDGGLVSGLLQTEDYIRATVKGAAPNVRQAEIDLRVKARLIRQRRLDGDDPLHLTAVISEAVLRQQVGGRAVLLGQLRHLIDMAERHPDNLDLRVVPFASDCYHALGGPTLCMMSFSSSRLPALVWQETLMSTDLIDNHLKVREYSLAYAQAADTALGRKDSLGLIGQIARELP